MLQREKYLNQLIQVRDLNLIKVITGVRRCGKSTLLKQYLKYLLDDGVQQENIIYMNFESSEWYDIVDYKDLAKYVKSKLKTIEKTYVLLDEVQLVEKWEKAVNSLSVDFNVDVYITGSNAFLLSSELSTLLSGRVYTIKIFPFSFKEFLQYFPFKENYDDYQKFDLYLKFGGMPMIGDMLTNDTVAVNYLNDLKEVVLKKDVIDRNKIKDTVFLNNLVNYMASCIGNLISPNAIADFMKKNGQAITNETVDSYLKMLENAYLIYRVPRYELKGRQLLKTQGKYYFVDNGLKNSVSGMSFYDSGSSYENLIYIELLRRGYEVYVGVYKDIEIDFIAVKPTETIYYQVSRSIIDENVEMREKKSLLCIKDNFQKVILTMDKIKDKYIDGIQVINIVDFLLQ